MRKQTIHYYTSSLDALVAVAKRLSMSENQYQMESEEFLTSTIGDNYQMTQCLLNGQTITAAILPFVKN